MKNPQAHRERLTDKCQKFNLLLTFFCFMSILGSFC